MKKLLYLIDKNNNIVVNKKDNTLPFIENINPKEIEFCKEENFFKDDNITILKGICKKYSCNYKTLSKEDILNLKKENNLDLVTSLVIEHFLIFSKYCNTKKVIAFDMDGVLANFEQGFIDILNKEKNTTYSVDDITEWNLINLFGPISYTILNSDNFFYNLKPFVNMINVLKILLKENKYKVFILTTCTPKAFLEKINWLQKYVPELKQDQIIPISDKYFFNADLLIDDGEHNIVPFKNNKILVSKPYNKHIQKQYPTISVYDDISYILNMIENNL